MAKVFESEVDLDPALNMKNQYHQAILRIDMVFTYRNPALLHIVLD